MKKFRRLIVQHHVPFKQSGMSLIEMLVAVSILGVIIGTATVYYGNLNRQNNTELLKSMMMSVAAEIEHALTNPDALLLTKELPANTALRNCMNPGSTCSGASTDLPGRAFTLLDASGGLVSNVGRDLNGGACLAGTASCIFSIKTVFWATCPLGAGNRPQASCQNPDYLNFKYEITNTRKSEREYAAINDYPYTGHTTDRRLSHVVRIRIANVLVREGTTCDVGYYLTGINEVGKAECECLVTETNSSGTNSKTNGNNKPVCGDQRCPKNSLMTGFQKVTKTMPGKPSVSGLIPRCRNQNDCSTDSPPADCPCKIVDLNYNGDCGPGFWMVSVDHGTCKAVTTKNGKGAPETVECSSRKGRCCSFEQQN